MQEIIIIVLVIIIIILAYLYFSNYQLSLKQLKRDKSILKNLLDSYVQPAFIIDQNARIQTFNKSVEDELHIALDHSLRDVKQLSFIYPFMKTQALNDEREVKIDEKYYLVNSSKFMVNELEWVFISFSDISYIKVMQNQQITFIQDASHELKTPIAGINGLCELIIDDKVEDINKMKEFVSIIYNENKRLQKIITKLTLTQSNQINNTYFNINSLLNEVSLIFTNYKEDIHLLVDSKVDTNIQSDQMIIKQIIVNLVENAYKYSEIGPIELKANVKKNKLYLHVIDNGVGIEQSYLPHIFDRFYRVDHSRTRNTGGNGLGLSIVKRLVDSLDGQINVTSELNKGSIFEIIIPIKK